MKHPRFDPICGIEIKIRNKWSPVPHIPQVRPTKKFVGRLGGSVNEFE
jgi:hypothetical protein